MDITIKIVDSYIGPGKPRLKLQIDGGIDDGHNIEADPGDRIIWENDDPKVFSYLITPKSDSQNIWDSGDVPPSHHTRNYREAHTVSLSAGKKKYKYTIVWKISKDDPHEYSDDPIIAIRSSEPEPFPIIGTGIGVIIGFLGHVIFRRMKNAKTWNDVNELEKKKKEIENRIEELKRNDR